jgi:hypothetical protein
MTGTSRAAARPAGAARLAGATRAAGRSRPHLRVVRSTPGAAKRAPFVVLVGGILGIGLLTLLILNTLVAQGAFTMHDLQQRNAALHDEAQQLRQQAIAASAPDALAARAQGLGMVPSGSPAFLRLPDGAVLGVPAPAKALPKPAGTP